VKDKKDLQQPQQQQREPSPNIIKISLDLNENNKSEIDRTPTICQPD